MVRVSAELIDVTDGSTKWSERYDRAYKDLFALQDEITRDVAGVLRAKLLPGEHAAARSERPPAGASSPTTPCCRAEFIFHAKRKPILRKAESPECERSAPDSEGI
jgi:hypothetical protein